MKVVTPRSVAVQIDKIAVYWSAVNPVAAVHLYEQLYQTIEKLAENPRRGRAVPGRPYREIVSIRPYIIRYRVAADAVYIIRVRHSSRRP